MPTDSKSYLHFGSAHPNHVYTGIVWDIGNTLRRIINSQTHLKQKMKDLPEAFIKCGYSKSMVKNITDKVIQSPSTLIKPRQPIIGNIGWNPDMTPTLSGAKNRVK